jgi:uncharacterized protein
MTSNSNIIAIRHNLSRIHVDTVLQLNAEGATIPFMARYRKDKIGGMDEVQIRLVLEEDKKLQEIHERKKFIIQSIQSQGFLTDQLMQAIEAATTIPDLEDIYLPYKPKRKTKAQIAREHGLEPLAILLLNQHLTTDCTEEAEKYLNEHVLTSTDALAGAMSIIAEQMNENTSIRSALRQLFWKQGIVAVEVIASKENEGIKFKDYYHFSEPVASIPSHRMLAVLRGFMEGVLKLSITPPEEKAISIIENHYLKTIPSNAGQYVQKAAKDAWRRLLQPSLESECRTDLKNIADEEAIEVFAENLKQLLLSAPLGNKKILAIDPGIRTGCKVVCLDEYGTLLHHTLIFIHEENGRKKAAETITQLISTYQTDAIAIGDGTAGRETEQLVKSLESGLPVFMVNEDGASIYSASDAAREEFPDLDITIRGAISIGRRLMDPLAELVKIEPKSIGIGQYQHDVNQSRLREKLDQAVISCVNKVGVNVNTASKHLLSYVSGIGPALADNIVQHRLKNGVFSNRTELLSVSRLGTKAFEQCAGFLRIKNGTQPLDASAVHPESYSLIETLARDMDTSLSALIGNTTLIEAIPIKKYVTEQTGILTIKDILEELKKPGLDPRQTLEVFEFAPIYTFDDVRVGMIVPGIVTNITRFGAFVDIGVKQDGLVHVSEIANRYIKDPSEALKLQDKVTVKVLETDKERKRIQLSIRQAEQKQQVKRHKNAGVSTVKQKAPASMQEALSALKKKFEK